MFLATGTGVPTFYSECVVSLRKDYAQEGNSITGTLVDFNPYGVSPSLDLVLDGNNRILISNTLDPKLGEEVSDRYKYDPNNPNDPNLNFLNYPLSGKQLGVIYCPENPTNAGLNWYGTRLVTDETQKDIYTRGGLGNFVDANTITSLPNSGLTPTTPKNLGTNIGGTCCHFYDFVNVACTGDDDMVAGNDIFYSFKVERNNNSTPYKELRISTADTDFSGIFDLYTKNSSGSFVPVSALYASSLGNGIYWEVPSSAMEILPAVSDIEIEFQLVLNSGSAAASGYFKVRMAAGNFDSPGLTTPLVSCCRMAIGENNISPIELTDGNEAFKLFPNPSPGTFWVDGLDDQQLFEIFDLTGKMVMFGFIRNSQINAKGLVSGIYHIKFSGREDISNVKLVIQP